MKGSFQLFVEKAHKLETSPFWRWLTSRRGPSDMDRIIRGDWLAHDGLRPEDFEAFCLTLRLLIQDGDGFSIREVARFAESWPDAYLEEKQGIAEARALLNARLDEASLVSLAPHSATTNAQLFDMIFYGGVVHSNPSKRVQYDQFAKSGLFSFFAFQAFSGVLMYYRNCIQTVAHYLVLYARKSEANPESCVRPERSGAVNTTSAEQARGGPETKPQPTKD